ncbi:hypothetical protein BJ912DRAFT_179109 [Pholiota molesta]|nr:hypothetical protein BJ912DRAFT_179109 [Pholiota molesta]
MPNTQTIAASTSEPQAFPTITFGFKKPGLRESLPESSSLDNGFKVANGSTASGFVEPPISHTMKFEAGPIYLQPGVNFTRFVNTAFNTASGAAYQLQHSPPSSPGWGSSRYADHGTPAANSMSGHYSMHNHLAQAGRTPFGTHPFNPIQLVRVPLEGNLMRKGVYIVKIWSSRRHLLKANKIHYVVSRSYLDNQCRQAAVLKLQSLDTITPILVLLRSICPP